MPHVSDYTKPEAQIVYDLINGDNNSNFTVAEFTLGNVTPIAGKVQMPLTAVQGSGYTSSVDVEYTRISIADFFDLRFAEGLTLQLGDAESMKDLLDEINTGLGTAIPVTSIIDSSFAPWAGTPNETQQVTLTISPVSRVYQGQVTFTLDGNDIPLEDAIGVKMLSGLNMPRNKTQLSELFTTNVLEGF